MNPLLPESTFTDKFYPRLWPMEELDIVSNTSLTERLSIASQMHDSRRDAFPSDHPNLSSRIPLDQDGIASRTTYNQRLRWVSTLVALKRGNLATAVELAKGLKLSELNLAERYGFLLELATCAWALDVFPDAYREAADLAFHLSRHESSKHHILLWEPARSFSIPGNSDDARGQLISAFESCYSHSTPIELLHYQHKILSGRGLLGSDAQSQRYRSRLMLMLRANACV